MKPQRRGAPGLGDQAQEPGLCPQQWRRLGLSSTGSAPGKTGCPALGQGDSEERFSPSGGGTPEPLPASAAPKLRVTECSPSSPSTAEDTRESVIHETHSLRLSQGLGARSQQPGTRGCGREDRGLRGSGAAPD